MSVIKTQEDLDNLRYSCKILMSAHYHIEKMIRPGLNVSELDKFIHEFAKKYNAKPNFYNYKLETGEVYKYALNVSINDEVVHGLANPEKIIPENCIISIDCGFLYKGMHSDAARTHIVGSVEHEIKELVKNNRIALEEGCKKVKAGCRTGDIGAAVNAIALEHGYGNVTDLGGHGLGYKLHDDPFISHVGIKGKGSKLPVNKVIAIEPMFTLGSPDIYVDAEDGWTIRTEDMSLAAHCEHDVLVKKNGFEILTPDLEESQVLKK